MAHDASPSWSGFNYQGKIAVYYAVRLINIELATDLGYDFSSHYLLLENNEDFEIKVADKSVSFHQVKAYQGSSFSKYKNALLGLALALQANTETHGYIHTWNPLNPHEGKDLKESIAHEIGLIVDEYKNAPSPLTTIIGKAAGNNDNIPKVAAIIRASLSGLCADDICTKLQKIKDDIDSVLTRISSYVYPDGNPYCTLSEIDLKLKSELEVAYGRRGILPTQEQKDRAFCCFLGYIDSHIRERHENIQKKIALPIAFTEILDILAR